MLIEKLTKTNLLYSIIHTVIAHSLTYLRTTKQKNISITSPLYKQNKFSGDNILYLMYTQQKENQRKQNTSICKKKKKNQNKIKIKRCFATFHQQHA